MNTSVSLGDALPKKIAEIRDIYIPAYESVGPAGAFAVALMKKDLDRATKAMAEGDLPEMLTAYQSLCEYKL